MLRVCAMDCILDEMVKLDILVFKSLSFLVDSAVACFMLNFTCGQLTVFVMILLLILIWNMWSLILKVTFGKGTVPCAKPHTLLCFVWNTYNASCLGAWLSGICNYIF